MRRTVPRYFRHVRLAAIFIGGLILAGGLITQGPRILISTYDVEGVQLVQPTDHVDPAEARRADLLALSSNGLTIMVVVASIVQIMAIVLVPNWGVRLCFGLQALLIIYYNGGNILVRHSPKESYETVLGSWGFVVYAYSFPLLAELAIIGTVISVISIVRLSAATEKRIEQDIASETERETAVERGKADALRGTFGLRRDVLEILYDATIPLRVADVYEAYDGGMSKGSVAKELAALSDGDGPPTGRVVKTGQRPAFFEWDLTAAGEIESQAASESTSEGVGYVGIR